MSKLNEWINVPCNCLSKTPEPEYHKEDCPVKLVDTMRSRIDELERENKQLRRLVPPNRGFNLEKTDE